MLLTRSIPVLARVLVHIPDKGHVTTRDDGWYANRPRGMRERAEPAAADGPPAIVPAPRRAPTEATRRWAARFQQIFEVDPLGCPTCRGAMRLVAVITQPSVIDQILTHLRTRATAAARRLVLVRSVVASYALPTPIEIPIPTPIAAPREKWEYSNIGFEALAHLVAVVSGETFEGYVKRHILAPAGMVHSTFLMTDVDSANLALGYESSPTGLRRAYPYNRRHAGSSTMHSSVEDMLRYGAIHAARGAGTGPQLLSPTTYDEMWKGQRDISEPFLGPAAERGNVRSAQMGLGWFLLDVDGQRVMSHDGADRGFRTAFLVSPDRHVVVVVFANSTVSVGSLAIPLLGAVLR